MQQEQKLENSISTLQKVSILKKRKKTNNVSNHVENVPTSTSAAESTENLKTVTLTLKRKKRIPKTDISDPLRTQNGDTSRTTSENTSRSKEEAKEETMDALLNPIDTNNQQIDRDYQNVTSAYISAVEKNKIARAHTETLYHSESDTETKPRKKEKKTGVATPSSELLRGTTTILTKKIKQKQNRVEELDLKNGREDQLPHIRLEESDMLNVESEERFSERSNVTKRKKDIEMEKEGEKLFKDKTKTMEEKKRLLHEKNEVAKDQLLPLTEQQLYYPINQTELNRQEDIFRIVAEQQRVGNGPALGAQFVNYVTAFNAQAVFDVNRNYVLRFIRNYNPATWKVQEPSDQYQIIIPPRTREEEDAYLFEPSEGERACRNGVNCEGRKMPAPAIPIMLKEFLYLSERHPNPLPSEPRFCVMCDRDAQASDYLAVRASVDGIKGKFCLQKYYNLHNKPGQYDLRQMYMSSHKDYQGNPKPTVFHVRSWYKQIRHPISGKLGFEQTGYAKFQLADEYWQKMDLNFQDFQKGLAT